MSERETTVRSAIVTYFPMAIAVLSLVTSIYNGWLNNKFVGIIQGNIGRVEYMHTCKEIIDAYFQVKFRAGVISAGRARTDDADARDRLEGDNAIAKFAALGTYLANLRDDKVRARYTDLSRGLERIMHEADDQPPSELAKAFAAVDPMFAELNDDCVKRAKNEPM